MTTDVLTNLLAQRVLGWTVARDRFLMGDRRWLPCWRFDPQKNFDHVFRLVDASRPSRYAIRYSGGRFDVEIEVNGRVGRAQGVAQPRVVAYALAEALDIKLPNGVPGGERGH